MRKLTIGVILVAVVVMLFLELCTVVAKPYQRILLDRFGKIVAHPTRLCYNWYLCWPTDRVIRLDTRLHLYQSDIREVTTAAGEPIGIRSFALWRIIKPVLYVEHLPGGSLEVQRYLNRKIEGAVLKVMGQYRLDQMFNIDPAKIQMVPAEHQIRQSVNKDMEKLGIRVSRVGFSRMTFPPRVALAVYDRMSAEREKIASRYKNEGRSEARAIVAKGQEQATEIRSEAEKKAEVIRGQGDARAYEILSAAEHSPKARLFYRFWKSLQLFKSSMGQSTYWVLTPRNPITAPLFAETQTLTDESGGAVPAPHAPARTADKRHLKKR